MECIWQRRHCLSLVQTFGSCHCAHPPLSTRAETSAEGSQPRHRFLLHFTPNSKLLCTGATAFLGQTCISTSMAKHTAPPPNPEDRCGSAPRQAPKLWSFKTQPACLGYNTGALHCQMGRQPRYRCGEGRDLWDTWDTCREMIHSSLRVSQTPAGLNFPLGNEKEGWCQIGRAHV